MDISLSAQSEGIIQNFIASGMYASTEQVIEQALLTLNATQKFEWGELDADLNFTSLTEEEMIRKSEAVVKEFEQSGHSISQSITESESRVSSLLRFTTDGKTDPFEKTNHSNMYLAQNNINGV